MPRELSTTCVAAGPHHYPGPCGPMLGAEGAPIPPAVASATASRVIGIASCASPSDVIGIEALVSASLVIGIDAYVSPTPKGPRLFPSDPAVLESKRWSRPEQGHDGAGSRDRAD